MRLFLPATVLCVGVLKALTASVPLRMIYDSLAVFALAYGVRFFYIPWKLSQSAMRSRSEAYRDVERVLGLACWRRCLLTLGGLMKPMALMGWLFVFALTLGELEIAAFLAQPGRQPLSVFLDNLMHYGRSATVVHWSLILIATELLIAVLVLKLGRSTWQRCSATT